MIKLLNIAGARPNFMKIAPIIHAIAARSDISAKLVHTGQHYDSKLSDVFFKELGIPKPDINLEIGSSPREEQIKLIADAFRPVVEKEQPDVVLVVGDVNSTIACATVARELGIKVAHVEAGLRSFDMAMPEEHNRVATDKISDFLFITEQSGMDNLEKEGVPGKRFLAGNVMIDTLIKNLEQAKKSTVLSDLGLDPKSFVVSTFHRPSNVDAKEDLEKVIESLSYLADSLPVLLPLHPRTKHSAEQHGLLDKLQSIPQLNLTEPLGYLDFLHLVSNAKAVVTDSGGIQEETTYLGVPCITMRENTERPVTLTLGTNVLIGSDHKKLQIEFEKVLTGSFKSGEVPPFWDGHASERIVEILVKELS